ncbi:MAG: type II toxin-antitoxin system RelE/ParE family toxin [Legionellaceae bacterium]|nr:type II toxin-antitoxin system RelE/ParE family toxin [Legionellaceae bacterium]
MNKKNMCKRAFKTSWFAKVAKKAKITDYDLFEAIQQVIEGKAVDLGGGVFKKRLNDNRNRSIILARGGCYWIYEYLFAKKDRDNIDDNELQHFRKLAKLYAELSVDQIDQLVDEKLLIEIYDDEKEN